MNNWVEKIIHHNLNVLARTMVVFNKYDIDETIKEEMLDEIGEIINKSAKEVFFGMEDNNGKDRV